MKCTIRNSALAASLFASVLFALPAGAQVQPSDAGVHATPLASLQGFVAVYAPVFPPAVVIYWFTYDEDGRQVWFISENIPTGRTSTEVEAQIFKPIGRFLDPEAALGEPVGLLLLSRAGNGVRVRFGVAPIEGFSDECFQLPLTPLPSPIPPPIPADQYPCQGRFVVERVTPVISELLGLDP